MIRISHVKQIDDIGTTSEVLQYLDLSFYFFLFDGLQHLDNAWLLRYDMDPLEYLNECHNLLLMQEDN